MSALREDNRRLTQTVTQLRADRRAKDRKIRDLEHEVALMKTQSMTAEPVPVLPVEVVAPPAYADNQRLAGVADDGSEIIYEGDAALGRSAVVGERPLVASRTPRAAVVRAAPAANDRAAADYRAAVELVKSGKSMEAATALRAFLKNYPRHEYADNAQYWLGEAFYAHKDYQHALVEFRATIETYPRGNKVPDALLKVGYCYQALGQPDKARAVLEQVVNLYPKTEPAALAAKRLESP